MSRFDFRNILSKIFWEISKNGITHLLESYSDFRGGAFFAENRTRTIRTDVSEGYFKNTVFDVCDHDDSSVAFGIGFV